MLSGSPLYIHKASCIIAVLAYMKFTKQNYHVWKTDNLVFSYHLCFDQTPLPAQAGPEGSKFAVLEMMSPRDIAYQLTYQDNQLFAATNLVII